VIAPLASTFEKVKNGNGDRQFSPDQTGFVVVQLLMLIVKVMEMHHVVQLENGVGVQYIIVIVQVRVSWVRSNF